MSDIVNGGDTIDAEKLSFEGMGLTASQQKAAQERFLSFVNERKDGPKVELAPPGSLNLPPLLEKRRLEWEIPDGVFRVAQGTVYDRILVYQIPLLAKSKGDDLTFGGSGLIIKTDVTRDKETREAPRGVIVGAGLEALDALRSHGVDIGHICYFARNSVYAIQVAMVGGKSERVSLARAGDLILSEDLAEVLRTGEAKVERNADGTHNVVVNGLKETRRPMPEFEDL